MAIIKYTTADTNGRVPSYITDGGYFYDARDDTYIGIGSGGGTELTKVELVTRMQTFSDLYPAIFTWDSLNDAGDSDLSHLPHNIDESTIRRVTEAEFETRVNDWCTSKGI
tara:strand:+ start:1353 stop:1685 length:333 start_codon:yes stop_codon:yes gene_type:complete